MSNCLFLGSSRLACSLLRTHASRKLPSTLRIHSSAVDFKVRRSEKIKKKSSSVIHSAAVAAENTFVQGALKEMKDVTCANSASRRKKCKSLVQVDLRVYEDLMVKLEKGDEHKMSHLGRVSLKSPTMVMINFADNPSAIKWAKLAIQKSYLNVTPQHEGVVLYLPVPRMTRERREQLAHDAKGKIFNEYKKALNDVSTQHIFLWAMLEVEQELILQIYIQFEKKSSQETTKPDEERHTRQLLLDLKHAMETKGAELIESKRKELLKEMA
ncbi:unnamed protein product [Cylicostephanus goldi]|uniref:Ribosome-recycling factor, mitochondrial n=1 Tax=Cylicostephanus goldi TaxID=71465 RepID=A0A3P6SBG8_CYLGO|nr:unnamed protein product [Cylicostephanus goldi]